MRGKKYYALVIGLILVGIGTFVFHRQQQETRILEFEGYEISLIEEDVEALFNAEKTDIQTDISGKTMKELETTFLGLMDKDFSGRNEQKIRSMYEDFLTAHGMFKVESDVEALFEDERVVKEGTTLEAVDAVKQAVKNFEEKTVYYDRNIERVDEAKEQVETIERVSAFLENLYDEEGGLKESVTREEEEEAFELIQQVRNPTVREKLRAEVEQLSIALAEAEENLALEEQRLLEEQAALEEEQRLLEEEAAAGLEEEPVTEPVDPWTPPANDGGSTWEPSPPPAYTPPSVNNPTAPQDPNPTPPSAPAPPVVEEEPPQQPEQPEDSGQPVDPPMDERPVEPTEPREENTGN